MMVGSDFQEFLFPQIFVCCITMICLSSNHKAIDVSGGDDV